jgi:hypothetical protein
MGSGALPRCLKKIDPESPHGLIKILHGTDAPLSLSFDFVTSSTILSHYFKRRNFRSQMENKKKGPCKEMLRLFLKDNNSPLAFK